ncbi:MAG TPA: excalibur calcium-binding domain-containing protein [Thiomonas arsenitoxydans]|nr:MULTISPECIES: excalibur calcium-binding domain-containing protein [Thiomonas]HML82028.1 excalibur calcium-binding domain-containing protein [Thiomonas arsenitoxydans]
MGVCDYIWQEQFLGAALFFALFTSAVEAAPMNKCIVNGTVTFQQTPCPSAQVRNPPSIDELNAAEKKKRAAQAAAQAAKQTTQPHATSLSGSSAATVSGFTCDGRIHCSQMRSCAEAKYFLAHCPGVKMDGNRDGTPCEQQWCSR